MNGRAVQVLSRFPVHLEATRPGKQLTVLAEAIAENLDVMASDLAGVRRAHRVGHAETLSDVLLLAGLHGLSRADLVLHFRKIEKLKELTTQLEAAIGQSAQDRDDIAEAVFDLWAVDLPEPRLALYAPFHEQGTSPDLDAAARALVAYLRSTLRYRAQVETVRTQLLRLCEIHAHGNGTVRTVLEAAANALDLAVDAERNAGVKAALVQAGTADELELRIDDEFFHSKDLFYHSSFVRERTPLVRAVPVPRPEQLVLMGERIAVSELADQMLLSARELAPVLENLEMGALQPSNLVGFEVAERIAAEFQFEVERVVRGVVHMERSITAAELARRIALRGNEVLARLQALGLTAQLNDVVPPELAARVARKFGYILRQRLPTGVDIIGIEENPLQRTEYEKLECEHGRLFNVIRRGFGRQPLQVRVTGKQNLTMGPVLVNRDEGHGLGYFGAVPDGKVLVFTEEGRALLDGADVTSSAFSFKGACFADAVSPDATDFIFAGGPPTRRTALFALATPAGALDRDFVFPHAGNDLSMPGLGIGVTRFAFFLQQAHLSSRDQENPTVIRRVAPHYAIGFADQSVFAATPPEQKPVGDTHPPTDYVKPQAASVVLSWLEHEAFALRVLIPSRFQALDENEGDTAARVARALERIRPAGVDLRVEYIDDRWRLGAGFMIDDVGEDPNLILRGGTVLWPAPPDN